MSSTTRGRARRRRPDVGAALMDAADAIADMAQRVQLNGPEPTYASEKLATRCTRRPRGSRCATSSSSEVTEEARRGYEHGPGSGRSVR